MSNKELYKQILAGAGGHLEGEAAENLDYDLNVRQNKKEWEHFHMDLDPNDPTRIVGKIKPGTILRFKKNTKGNPYLHLANQICVVQGNVVGFSIREPISDHGGFEVKLENGLVDSFTMWFWAHFLELENPEA